MLETCGAHAHTTLSCALNTGQRGKLNDLFNIVKSQARGTVADRMNPKYGRNGLPVEVLSVL